MRTLLDLPVDVLVHVVSSMPSFDDQWRVNVALREVCTHTRTAALTWAQSIDDVDLKASVVSTCVAARTFASSLRRITCGGYWSIVTDVVLATLALYCPHLTHVDTSRCPALSSEGVALLACGCPSLVYLDLTECYNVDSVAHVARACPALEHVDLTWCYMVGDDSVEALALHCPQLTYLSTHACHRVTDVSVLAQCPSLTHINVSGCMLLRPLQHELRQSGAATAAAAALAHTDRSTSALRACRRLVHLNVSGCGTSVDDDAIAAIARGCPALVHVRVASCTSLTDVAITALARGCVALTHIDVSSVHELTDVSFVALARHCAQLRHVRAAHCALVGDTGLRALASGCVALTHLDMWECTRVTDAGVEALARECAHLRFVCFRGSKLTEIGVLALVASRSSTTLRHIDVHDALVSVEALARVRAACPHIWHLDVTLNHLGTPRLPRMP